MASLGEEFAEHLRAMIEAIASKEADSLREDHIKALMKKVSDVVNYHLKKC